MPIVGQRQAGTGYTNVSRILGANQGAGMGTALAQTIGQAGESAQSAYEKDAQKFNKEAVGVQSEDVEKARNVIGQAASGLIPTTPPTPATPVPAGQTTPTTVTPAQPPTMAEAMGTIGKVTSGYRGPTSLSGEGEAAARKASTLGRSSVGQLLQGEYGRSQAYTPGLRRFDEMLVSRSPQLEGIRQAQAGAAGAQGQYQRLQEFAKDKAQQLQKEATGVAEDIKGTIGTAQKGVQTGVTNALTEAQKQATNTATALSDKISAGRKLTSDDIKLLSDAGINLEGTSGNMTREQLAKLIRDNSANITAANVMSEKQASALQALSQLSGQDRTAEQLGIDRSAMGKYSPLDIAGVTKGMESAASYIKQKEAEWTPQLTQLKTNVDQLNTSVQDKANSYNRKYGIGPEDAMKRIEDQQRRGTWHPTVYDLDALKAIEDYKAAKQSLANANNAYNDANTQAHQEMQDYMTGNRYRTIADLLGIPMPSTSGQTAFTPQPTTPPGLVPK